MPFRNKISKTYYRVYIDNQHVNLLIILLSISLKWVWLRYVIYMWKTTLRYLKYSERCHDILWNNYTKSSNLFKKYINTPLTREYGFGMMAKKSQSGEKYSILEGENTM